MQLRSELNRKIEPWNLLSHPFYEAWNAGELPERALKTYAEEYGAFIALVPDGWRRVGDKATAREEEEHIEMWGQFADGLGTNISGAVIDEVKQLVDNTNNWFAAKATALGALYAFEAQQPETAKSKLAGLKEYYEFPSTVETYFDAHTRNEQEADKLLARIEQLDEGDRKIAQDACEKMSKSLWDALTGIHNLELARNVE
jgi:pyrroloquinoline-quinone synthase